MFKMKDLGEIKNLARINIYRDRKGGELCTDNSGNFRKIQNYS